VKHPAQVDNVYTTSRYAESNNLSSVYSSTQWDVSVYQTVPFVFNTNKQAYQ